MGLVYQASRDLGTGRSLDEASSSQAPCNKPIRAGNEGWEKTKWQIFDVDVKKFVFFL